MSAHRRVVNRRLIHGSRSSGNGVPRSLRGSPPDGVCAWARVNGISCVRMETEDGLSPRVLGYGVVRVWVESGMRLVTLWNALGNIGCVSWNEGGHTALDRARDKNGKRAYHVNLSTAHLCAYASGAK